MGTDLAKTDFWRRALDDASTSVIEGTFTREELTYCNDGTVPTAERLATRFAAKEAFLKALGASRYGTPPLIGQIPLIDIEIVSDAWGRPSIRLHGQARKIAAQLNIGPIWVSLSHEDEYATATVILESKGRSGGESR
ncbi:MAG: holo-ACP synthase [Myxococcota bacterium]|nr:holo-ACP synthase [Myxococcota bacterium]